MSICVGYPPDATVLRLERSRGGICSVSPFVVSSNAFDNLEGVLSRALSSLAFRVGSLNLGDGDKAGVESDKDRVLDGVFVTARDNASESGKSLALLDLPSFFSGELL